MGEKWYCVQDKKKIGPMTRAQLQQLAKTGQVRRTDMVLKEGEAKWQSAAEVQGLLAALPAGPPTLPAADPLTVTPPPKPLLRPVAAVSGPSVSTRTPLPSRPVADATMAAAPETTAAAPKPAAPVSNPSVAVPAPEKPSIVAAPAVPPPTVAQWFYVQANKRIGPVALAQLQQLVVAGKLQIGDMVLKDGQAKWQRAGDVSDLFPTPIDDELEDDDDEDDEDGQDDPDDEEVDVDAYLDRARQFQGAGEYAKAVAEYEELVRQLPDEPEGYHGLAALWATCPQAEFRNGARAVEYATLTIELAERPDSEADESERLAYQETLAAAHAEAGDFAAAVAAIDRALLGVAPQDQRRLAERRAHFVENKPYRDLPAANPPQAAEKPTDKPPGLLGRFTKAFGKLLGNSERK